MKLFFFPCGVRSSDPPEAAGAHAAAGPNHTWTVAVVDRPQRRPREGLRAACSCLQHNKYPPLCSLFVYRRNLRLMLANGRQGRSAVSIACQVMDGSERSICLNTR
jgi:hypothetical protein